MFRAGVIVLAGLALVGLGACGPRTSASSETSASLGGSGEDQDEGSDDSGESGESGVDEDVPHEPKLDFLGQPPAECDCAPGQTCKILSTDGGCSAYCVDLPPSCGDAPSCDPACNWDLCEHIQCNGVVNYQDWCFGDGDVDGWGCSQAMLCSVWTQNCPEGEHCLPWAYQDGSWWETTRCHPSEGTVELGGTCTRSSGGPYDSFDDCVPLATCWDVDADTQQGTCVPLCTGAPHDPSCPPGTDCVLADPMDAAFCLPACDPFADACAPRYGCTLVGATFACMPRTPIPAGLGSPCAVPNDCEATLACVDDECVALCQLDAPVCPPETPTCAALPSNAPGVGLCE